MNNITVDDLFNEIKKYDIKSLDIIKKAYEYANILHSGQIRQSGEPYIIHPVSVAYILAEMHADSDTICAALLHDTLEDTKATKEDIENDFNKEIAKLVDGVTKIKKLNFSSAKEQELANTRKIITSITDDVRIIIIKLADRLHNMRTLQYKSKFKQKEISLETMEIFTPLAYYIGAYRIKSELEDLSFKYLKPDRYKEFEEKLFKINVDSKSCLNEMLSNIFEILSNKNIPNEIKIRTKNIYGLYKSITQGYKISEIHDLLSMKIMVDEIQDCYIALGLIHSIYNPIHNKFKDYICNPKTNLYRSLHTTVFGPEERLVQTQIRTFDMDKIASFGLTAYWDINKENARIVMQEDLNKKFQKSLIDINYMFKDNQEFVSHVKRELFEDKIYVYTSKGELIELPKGSSIIDFAYQIHTHLGNNLIGAKINDKYFDIRDIFKNGIPVLKNNDRVIIITDNTAPGPDETWLNSVQTTRAKKKIKEYIKNNGG